MTWRSGCGLFSVNLVLVKLFCLVLLVPPVPLELFPPRMSFQGSSPAHALPGRAHSFLQHAQGRDTDLAGVTWAGVSQVSGRCPAAPRACTRGASSTLGCPGKVRREVAEEAEQGCVLSAPELPDAQLGKGRVQAAPSCHGCAFLSSV